MRQTRGSVLFMTLVITVRAYDLFYIICSRPHSSRHFTLAKSHSLTYYVGHFMAYSLIIRLGVTYDTYIALLNNDISPLREMTKTT